MVDGSEYKRQILFNGAHIQSYSFENSWTFFSLLYFIKKNNKQDELLRCGKFIDKSPLESIKLWIHE